MRATLASLEPTRPPRNLEEGIALHKIASLLFDRLVYVDDGGQPQPRLAISWKHDSSSQRWEFHLRPGVKFQDGVALTPADVADSLNAAVGAEGSWKATVVDSAIVIQSDRALPGLLRTLAAVRYSIHLTLSNGTLAGTGPFRVVEWQPPAAGGSTGRLLLSANDNYWDGRPFLDSVEILLGRTLREQAIDWEVGKADVVEVAPGLPRRAAQREGRTWQSEPEELMALELDPNQPSVADIRLRQTLSLSLDRAAMFRVLLQKQGEIAGGLLPQWLSGYAFLFPAAADPDRAREIVTSLPSAPHLMQLSYDPMDPLARSVAGRIALNASEAGIALQAVPRSEETAPLAPIRLVRVRVNVQAEASGSYAFKESFSPGYPFPLGSRQDVDQLYSAERAALARLDLIPLFHLPETYGLSPRVKNWAPPRWGGWRLEMVWVDPGAGAPEAGSTP